MIIAIITAVIAGLIGIGGIALKWWLGRKPDPAQAVEKTDHAMEQRAVDRDSPADTDDKLRDGRF